MVWMDNWITSRLPSTPKSYTQLSRDGSKIRALFLYWGLESHEDSLTFELHTMKTVITSSHKTNMWNKCKNMELDEKTNFVVECNVNCILFIYYLIRSVVLDIIVCNELQNCCQNANWLTSILIHIFYLKTIFKLEPYCVRLNIKGCINS